jgi:hypothetical protein
LPGKIPQHRDIAANFNFSGSIHNYFYCALAAIRTTASHYRRTSWKGLRAGHSGYGYHPEKNTLKHVYHPLPCSARCQPFT